MTRRTLLHVLWRIVTFLIVVLLTITTLFFVIPYLGHRVSLIWLILAIYILIAYVFIPLVVRFWRIVMKPDHLPRYVLASDGWPSDPINIVIVTHSKRQLINSMKTAGWTVAGKSTIASTLKLLLAIVFQRSYPEAPFSKLYLFGRHQDIGFQMQTGDPPSPRHRHHVRFWQLHEEHITKHSSHHEHATFWRRLLHTISGTNTVWIGAATHDVGPLAIRRRNGQITHQISQYTEDERDFIIETLQNAGLIRSKHVVNAGAPLKINGQTFGVSIIVDGNVVVIRLRRKLLRPRT